MASMIVNLSVAVALGAGAMLAIQKAGGTTESAAPNSFTPVTASSDSSSAGFRDFRFGMSKDELHAVVEVRKSEDRDDGTMRLYAAAPVTVGIHEFDLYFDLGNSGLEKVVLTKKHESMSFVACNVFADIVLADVSKKYGNPIGEPIELTLPGGKFDSYNYSSTSKMNVKVALAFVIASTHRENGDTVRFPISKLSGSCMVNVIYLDASRENSGF